MAYSPATVCHMKNVNNVKNVNKFRAPWSGSGTPSGAPSAPPSGPAAGPPPSSGEQDAVG